MKAVLVILACLTVGAFAMPTLPEGDLKLMKKLLRMLEEKTTNSDVELWVESNANLTMYDNLDLPDVDRGMVVDEIMRLVDLYMAQNNKQPYEKCVQIVASMGMIKHILENRIRLGLKYQIMGMVAFEVLKNPVDARLMDVIMDRIPLTKMLNDPAVDVFAAVNAAVMSFDSSIDLNMVTNTMQADEDKLLEVAHLDTSVGDIIKDVVKSVVKVIDGLNISPAEAPTKCGQDLPIALVTILETKYGEYMDKLNETNIIEKVNALNLGTIADKKTAKEILKNVTLDLRWSFLGAVPDYMIQSAIEILEETANNQTSPFLKYTFNWLLLMTMEIELGMMEQLERVHQVLGQINQAGLQQVMNTKLKDANQADLTRLVIKMREIIQDDIEDPNCAALRFRATISGVIQTERLSLAQGSSVATNMASSLMSVLNTNSAVQLGLNLDQMKLTKHMKKALSTMYIRKVAPFARGRRELVFELIPLTARLLAKEQADLPTKETIKKLLVLTGAGSQMFDYMECQNLTIAEVKMEVQGLVQTLDQVDPMLRNKTVNGLVKSLCADGLSPCPLPRNVTRQIGDVLKNGFVNAVANIKTELQSEGVVNKRVALLLYQGANTSPNGVQVNGQVTGQVGGQVNGQVTGQVGGQVGL